MENVIKRWIDNPNRSYDEGVALFVKFGGNRFQARYFANTQARFAEKKLLYELGKLAKQGRGNVETPAQMPDSQPQEPACQPQEPGDQPLQKVIQPQGVDETKPKADIPEPAAIAKRIVHETWLEISRITEELYSVGTGNDEASMARRRALLEERLPLIERYNQMYEAKEAFFNGELDEQQLLAVINQEQPKEENKQSTDYSQLSDLELTKRIKAVKQVINRSNNQLLYQQNTVAKTENPMPDCPRRRDIEQRISVSKSELDNLTDIARQRGLIK